VQRAGWWESFGFNHPVCFASTPPVPTRCIELGVRRLVYSHHPVTFGATPPPAGGEYPGSPLKRRGAEKKFPSFRSWSGCAADGVAQRRIWSGTMMGAGKRSVLRMAWRLSKLHRRFDDLHRHSDFSSARLRPHHVALTLEHHLALGPLEFHRKTDQLPERAGGLRCPEEHARRADVTRDAPGALQEYRQCGMNPLLSSSFRLFCSHRPRNFPVYHVAKAQRVSLCTARRVSGNSCPAVGEIP